MYPWLLYKINRYLALIICSIFLLNGPAFTACLMPNISERLINFCLLERTKDSIVPLTFAKEFDYRLKRSGYSNGVGLSGKVEQSVINYNFSPVFYYSSNINGGNPDKDLVLGDYIFKGDRNLLRKKGFLTGVSSGLNGRSIYGEGRHFDFYAQVSHAHSFQYNMGINNLSSGFCFANHIKAFWHIDICGNSSQIRRKIVSERNSDLSLNLAKLSTSNSSPLAKLKLKVGTAIKPFSPIISKIAFLIIFSRSGCFKSSYFPIVFREVCIKILSSLAKPISIRVSLNSSELYLLFI